MTVADQVPIQITDHCVHGKFSYFYERFGVNVQITATVCPCTTSFCNSGAITLGGTAGTGSPPPGYTLPTTVPSFLNNPTTRRQSRDVAATSSNRHGGSKLTSSVGPTSVDVANLPPSSSSKNWNTRTQSVSTASGTTQNPQGQSSSSKNPSTPTQSVSMASRTTRGPQGNDVARSSSKKTHESCLRYIIALLLAVALHQLTAHA